MAKNDHEHAVWPRKVRNAVNHIDRNLGQDISLSEVADMVGMNKCSLCRLFRQATGMTFTHYLNLKRLELAKELLSSSDTYIFQIARQAGFRNEDYFRHLFRKHCGCSPTEYRDTHRNR